MNKQHEYETFTDRTKSKSTQIMLHKDGLSNEKIDVNEVDDNDDDDDEDAIC